MVCDLVPIALVEGEPMGHLPSPEDGPQQLVEWPVTGLLNSPLGWRGEPLLAGAALTQNVLAEVRLPIIRKGQSQRRRFHSFERYFKKQFPYQSCMCGIALCFQREVGYPC